MTAMPWGQKKRAREISQSQTVTPPFAAMEGTTLRLKTATTKRRIRSRRPRTRRRWGAAVDSAGVGTSFGKRKITQLAESARDDANGGAKRAASVSFATESASHFLRPRTSRRADPTKEEAAQWPAAPTKAAPRCCWAAARAGATSSKTERCLSISASVCWTETVHCSSHQYG